MNNIQPFNYVGHWTGTGTTSGAAVSITTAPYTRSTVDSSSGTTSRFQWRPSTQTAAPDKRVLRPRNRMSVAYLITVRPTTATWQTRLTRMEIATNPFVRPDHVHCVPGLPTSFSTVASASGTTYTAHYPGAIVVPNPILELSSGNPRVVSDRIVGNSSGEVRTNGISGDVQIFDSERIFATGIFSQGFAPYTRILSAYQLVHGLTSPITTNIWPQDTFTSWGMAHIGANTDWCPPIIVEASDTVDFEASMSLWIIDRPVSPFTQTNLRAISESGQRSLTNLAVSPPTPAAPPFAFSRHRILPAGQYWRTLTYPATYASPTARWSAVPGSSSTGFTPPITEPSCPFVITPGVPD